MRASISDLVHTLFKVRPEELRRTLLAFVYLFTSVGAFIVGRISRTVLFLEIPDYKDQLPLMYVLIAVTVSLAMTAYARFERKLRRDVTNAVTLGVIIAITLVFRFLLRHHEHALYWAFYIWVEVYGSFLVVQFWAMANEIFNSRQAKRLFAVIGGGGVIANVFIGFAISGSVKALGTENLLYVMVGLFVVSLVSVLYLGGAARGELAAAHERAPAARPKAKAVGAGRQTLSKIAGGGSIFSSRHVQLIATVVVVVYVVSTLADYQFQVIVGDSIPGKDDRSAFMGTFFGVTGIVAAIIQFFFTSRLLERFGILVALSLLPTAMMTGSVGLLFAPLVPALWAVTATKGSENILRYTINDSTLQLFYLPLPTHIRSRVKTIIDGILKPLAIGGAGIVMGVLVGQLEKYTGWPLGLHLGPKDLAWVVVVALAMWLVALVQLRKEYLVSLVRTLQRRRLNFADARFEVSDEATVKFLLGALGSTDVGQVMHALELVRLVTPRAQATLHEKVTALLRHPSDEVRVAALGVLGGASQIGPLVRDMLEDASPRVRSAATLATCAILHERALESVHPLLEDYAPEVRSAAVAGLIRHGGLDGVLASADTLKRMLSSPSAVERKQAAWVLGTVGVQTFFQPLLPLLDDADEEVRLAAVSAAGSLAAPALIEPLVRQLGNARIASAAAAALAAYGPEAVDTVAVVLADDERDRVVRASACKVLAKLGDPRSVALLHEVLANPDALVRGAAVAALTAVSHRDSSLRVDRAVVAQALRAEAKHAFELIGLALDLAADDDALLLHDAITHRQQQSLGRIFGLLALRYDAETIDLVSRNLHSSVPATRANAVEVLDNLVAGDEKTFVVALCDDAAPAKKLELVAAFFEVPRTSRRERLRDLLAGSDEWLQVCAAMAAGAWRVKELEPEVRALLDSPSALCRETAIVALRSLTDLGILRQRLEGLRTDPAKSVSRYAEHVLAEIA